MENHFVIRTYGFRELAQLYSPHVTPKTAAVKLRKWIGKWLSFLTSCKYSKMI
ncbi:MAG TPA: DUF4248 domain-containing protein [Bacteroidales bacterium]|nr:DUF4248 domain-containing protein [Bacteroidales bacterium]